VDRRCHRPDHDLVRCRRQLVGPIDWRQGGHPRAVRSIQWGRLGGGAMVRWALDRLAGGKRSARALADDPTIPVAGCLPLCGVAAALYSFFECQPFRDGPRLLANGEHRVAETVEFPFVSDSVGSAPSPQARSLPPKDDIAIGGVIWSFVQRP
jgi:hypothetical protein